MSYKKQPVLYTSREVAELKLISKLPLRSIERTNAMQMFAQRTGRDYNSVQNKVSYILNNGFKKRKTTRTYNPRIVVNTTNTGDRTYVTPIKSILIRDNNLIIKF